MNIKITARYGSHWEGVVSHDAYGGLLEFTATGATRPEPIRCSVSVFRAACELARALATAAAKKAISELEVAALGGYTRLGKVYPLPGSAEPETGPDGGDCRTIDLPIPELDESVKVLMQYEMDKVGYALGRKGGDQ
jgi:hypothetical protein